ncbi:MAG: hypothetical protein ABIN94_16870 [Ferruginibacter sp.]
MFQPFILFEKKYLQKLIQLQKVYLVTQSYSRAYDPFANEIRVDILVTDYSQAGQAEIHLNALKRDKYGSIIRLDNERHKNKLVEMLAGEKYRIFWSVVQSNDDIKKRLAGSYKNKVRKYIDCQTSWRISGDDAVKVEGLEVTFGELFVTLKWRTQKLRIKFEDIENA